MGSTRTRGAGSLASTLAAAGIRRVFTLSGNHIMPVFDAAIDAGIELIHVRHEAAAVHMADAWGRLTGEPGVALVTGGPGHANAVSALYTATLAESPAVLLSGHAPNAQLGSGAFQEMRQAEMAAPVTKASWTCAQAADVAHDVATALALAQSGRPGAVHLSLPSDVLEGEVGAARALERQPARRAADPRHSLRGTRWSESPDSQLARLYKAKRPLILTGPGGLTKRSREKMAILEAACGIAVVGMESPRGVADPSLGAFAQVLAQADVVLLLGKRRDYTLNFGKPPVIAPGCELLEVDVETTPLLEAADSLTRAALARGPMKSAWLGEVRSAIAYRPAAWDSATSSMPGRVHPVQALRPLQALLDAHPDAVFVCDGGEFGQWALACLGAPNRVMNGVAGPIGVALPFAAAACLAKPGAPVIAVLGDGTFGFHPAEIDTAVRYKLPFLAVLGNDARWNAEYQIQLRDYGAARARGTELLPARYDIVAQGFGGYGALVTEASEVMPAARSAIASELPALLNVMIDGVAAPTIRR